MADDAHILVVDDDARLRGLLSRYLAGEGFRVTTADNAADARAKLRAINPDLLVLDVMMPGESGLDLTEALRIAGFEAGADDYLGKPFEPRELVLRIRAMLRRAPPPAPEPPAGPIQLGELVFDRERGELRDADGPLRLTGGEAALLSALAAKPNEVLSREEIAAALSMDDAGERAIDVQVTRLRRKDEADPRDPRFLHTVRGRGYVLKPGA